VRTANSALVGFSKQAKRLNGEMKKFLYRNMYRHYRVARMASKAERVIRDIFEVYMQTPAMLPEHQQALMQQAERQGTMSPERLARLIADYIAGMTDRYALEEHDRLFNVHVRP